MENKILEHKKLRKMQNYWLIAIGGIIVALFVAIMLTIAFPILGVPFFLLVIAAEIYSIIKLSKCSKALNKTGMDIATNLALSCDSQKELKDKLIEVGISRNLATNYSIRILGQKEVVKAPIQTITNSTPKEIKCPQCHTDKVHWIPYEKASFGKAFYIWLILSLLGVSFSPLITIIMMVVFILTLIVRIIDNRASKKVNCYQCNMCGHKFEIQKQ